jgi:hypothetical protein
MFVNREILYAHSVCPYLCLCVSVLQIFVLVQSKTAQYILKFTGKFLLHGIGSLQALLRMTVMLDFWFCNFCVEVEVFVDAETH